MVYVNVDEKYLKMVIKKLETIEIKLDALEEIMLGEEEVSKEEARELRKRLKGKKISAEEFFGGLNV
ncbi:hypothetical protein J7J90_01565 [Candidatus Micrarchaeota archaeon]|nr:hypothetical protein [Candidatus Micrarchaeota archaeon]